MKASTINAIDHLPDAHISRAAKLYERFTADGLNPAPWLWHICQLDGGRLGKCKITRSYNHVRTPAEDHVRGFIGRRTKERVLTVQPYFSVRRPDGEVWDFDEAANGEPVIFADSHTGLGDEEGLTIPEFTVLCEQFASEHNLTVRVSLEDSWYYPGRTVLIEYRKATQQ